MSDLIRHPWADPPGPGEAVEIAEGVLWLRLPLPMKLDHVNVFALEEPDGWTLVDTGLDWRKGREALEAALSGPLGGRPVTRLLITHHHPDHIGLAGVLQARFGSELITSRTSFLMARMLTLDVQDRPSDASMAFAAASGMSAERLAARRDERPFNFADVVAAFDPGYTRVRAGEVIVLGGRRWQVRVGHGHAPEHVTLWEEDGPLVLAGDQILPGISPHLGVYLTEADADPVSEWIAACRDLRAHARPDHLVLPGHKTPFTGLAARLDQLIDNHVSALDRIEAFLEVPRRAPDCFVTLFKREIGDAEYGLALSETLAHLNALHHAGRARREIDADGVWQWHGN
ncbi:MAG: MBL fold metallo-hydrolase [Pseudomonadota bacterium]